ncbi:MAG: DUF2634 domain-containing protein [Cetobacterium sp.]|uniref:contractile injection system sheath initiator n=1 Tax=Cetobacterium sp. TaxID=2071632 RepID=UPI003F3F8414
MLPNNYNNSQEILAEIKAKEIEKENRKINWKELAFDFSTGKFIYEGSDQAKLGTKKEIIKQWIKKLFYTQRDKWDCYIKDSTYPFGLILHRYIGQQLYPDNFLIELIKEDIYNSLLSHENIKEIHYLQLIQIDDVLYCGFIVILDDDTALEIEEVINH